jgi:aminoglycoside phosphotransferase family enzyme/predicted kinase
MNTHSLLDFLAEPKNYPQPPVRVERGETDFSWLFFAGPHVYKLKKPIQINGCDYSSAAAREKACQRELRLNARLAQDVYESVVPLFCSTEGKWSFDGFGQPAEFCIRMRRLDRERMLDQLIAHHDVSDADLDALADALGTFLAAAKTSEKIGRAGSAASIETQIRAYMKSLRECRAEAAYVERIESALLEYLARNQQRFEQRSEQGKIRDGHGDLRAEHICMTSPTVVLDCVEFNDRARHIDVLCDAAGLIVDLARRGREDLAAAFRSRIADRLDEKPDDPLIDFYCILSAAGRAREEALWEVRRTGSAATGESKQTLALADQWARRIHQPKLFVTVGPMGIGKSTLAHALAQTLALKRLSAEAVCQELSNPVGEAPRRKRKCPIFLERVYAEMLVQAEDRLMHGGSVVLDGRYLKRSQRNAVIELADRLGARILFLDFRLSKSDAIARLTQRFRKDRTNPGSRPELYDEQRSEMEPLDDLPSSLVLTLNAIQPVPALVDEVLESL